MLQEVSLNHSLIQPPELIDSLQNYLELIRSWQPRYDLSRWNQTVFFLDSIYSNLYKQILLAIEYQLYGIVKDLFVELRNFLQWTGRVQERVFIASWLRREAENRGDIGGKLLALSSLTWSYTTSGAYRDIDKAYNCWRNVSSCFFKDNCFDNSSLSQLNPLYSLDSTLFNELVVETIENRIRIAIRWQDNHISERDEAHKLIDFGKDMLMRLEEPISNQLIKRYEIAFRYHEGIISYLEGKTNKADEVFNSIVADSELIGWERVVKAAKSWRATLALKDKKYEKCSLILDEIRRERRSGCVDQRDIICFLIQSYLYEKKGLISKKLEQDEELCKSFESYGRHSDRFQTYKEMVSLI